MTENLRNLLARVTDELDALNCAFREHIDDCAEPEEEHERCDATDELLEQARAALAEQAPAPCPICDANEVVELRTKHCLKCDADFAGANEMSANKAAVLAARAKRIEPDSSIAACAAITHRMVDAFKVAFHQHQRMAVTYDESVHIGLAAALSARPAQTEQQPIRMPCRMWESQHAESPEYASGYNTALDHVARLNAARPAQTAQQPEQSRVDTFELPELGRGLNPLDASAHWITAYRAATGLTLAEAREEGRRRRAALSAQGADEQ